MSQDNESLTYEQQLQLKLEEYQQAESAGKLRTELLQLYKEIKALQLQVITSTPSYQYWSKKDNTETFTDYRV